MTSKKSNGIILDTHALIWWLSDTTRLSKKALKAIQNAPSIAVAAISFWEVAMLAGKGRITLDRPALAWANGVSAMERVKVINLDPTIAITAGELPSFHGDPADRIIYATALRYGITLVSADNELGSYCAEHGQVELIW